MSRKSIGSAVLISLAVLLLLMPTSHPQDSTVQANRINKFNQPQVFPQIWQTGPAANTGSTPAAGFAGIVTLAGSTATVTFPTAYTAIPVCLAVDQTTPQLIKAAPTVSTVVLTDTVGATDVVAWVCVGNPN